VNNQNATRQKNAVIRKKEQRERYVPEQMISFFLFQFLINLPWFRQFNIARKEKKRKKNPTTHSLIF